MIKLLQRVTVGRISFDRNIQKSRVRKKEKEKLMKNSDFSRPIMPPPAGPLVNHVVFIGRRNGKEKFSHLVQKNNLLFH